MAGCQDIGIGFQLFAISSSNMRDIAFFDSKIGQFFFKQYFSASVNDELPHGSNDMRQFVGADMRMGIV